MIDIRELKKQLEKSAFITEAELFNTLHVFPHINTKEKKCEFILIKCTKDKIREEDFLDFLFRGIIHYALTTQERTPPLNIPPEDINKWWEKNGYMIFTKALNRFVNSEYAGELGELLLFMILESKGIIQLLNKMSLKTSKNMPVHGLDGIHIEISGDDVIIHYGYSKIHQKLSDAIYNIFNEVNVRSNNQELIKQEINLVSSRIDKIQFGNHYEDIIKLINPYYPHKENMSEVNSLFIGYEWEQLSLNPLEEKSLTNYQVEMYKDNFDSIWNRINKKIHNTDLIKNDKYSIYIMPFKNVDYIRNRFNEKMMHKVNHN